VTAQPPRERRGPKGKVAQKLDREMKVTVDKGRSAWTDQRLAPLARAPRPDADAGRQMILGVTQGFTRSLDISGSATRRS